MKMKPRVKVALQACMAGLPIGFSWLYGLYRVGDFQRHNALHLEVLLN
jgi:hypothetical protein